LDTQNAGAPPWSIQNNTESTLLLFNHSKESQTFTVTVSSGGMDWQKEYRLASMQTKAINIRELIDEQIKDDKGKAIPKNASSGETGWLVADPGKGSGRLLQSDHSTGMARNFSCGYSGLLCGSNTNIFNNNFGEGLVAEFANITGITCTGGTPNACTGQQTGTAHFTTSWISLSPSVLPISGSSSSPPVSLQGVSMGTSRVNGHISSASCQSGGGGTATVVATPTNFRQTAVVNQGNGVLKFTYEWDSTSGNTADLSSCIVEENVAYPGGNPFHWTSPPYAALSTSPNPTRNDGVGTDPAPTKATDGGTYDSQLNPGFLKPYVANSFTATQTFQYSCTNVNNGAWVTFPSISYSIQRAVTQNANGTWQYTLTKAATSSSYNPLP
jgi:hypothetical protein